MFLFPASSQWSCHLRRAAAHALHPVRPKPGRPVLRFDATSEDLVGIYNIHVKLNSIFSNLLRTIFTLTSTSPKTEGRYRVHELVTPSDPVTSTEAINLHGMEVAGSDIQSDQDGLWREFISRPGFRVSAAPVVHRSESIRSNPCRNSYLTHHLPSPLLGIRIYTIYELFNFVRQGS